jgi:hypothetical protein
MVGHFSFFLILLYHKTKGSFLFFSMKLCILNIILVYEYYYLSFPERTHESGQVLTRGVLACTRGHVTYV